MRHDSSLLVPPDPGPRWAVLVVDVDPAAGGRVAACLRAGGHRPTVVATVAAAVSALACRPVDLVCLAVDRDRDGVAPAVGRLWAAVPGVDVVVLGPAEEAPAGAGPADVPGHVEYLAGPVSPAAVAAVVRRLAGRRRLANQVGALRADRDDDPDAGFPTGSADVRRVLDLARRVAASEAPVLVVGEPGTGTGRLARAVHDWGPRAGGPLGVVTAGGPAEAVDADWFGSADGGADGGPEGGPAGDPHGRVARCRGGTLVVERVGDLPLAVQPKLLRLVTDRQYERHDEVHARPADVRVVATATDDLSGPVAAGRFRADLRAALDVVRLDLPPLRDRPGDVPLLAGRYLAHAARRHGRDAVAFSPEASAALARHAWPGNLWELRNAVERAAWAAAGEVVDLADLPPHVRGGGGVPPPMPGDPVSLRTIEDAHIRRVLAATGNARAAAAVLGIDPSTLWRRLRPRGGGPGQA